MLVPEWLHCLGWVPAVPVVGIYDPLLMRWSPTFLISIGIELPSYLVEIQLTRHVKSFVYWTNTPFNTIHCMIANCFHISRKGNVAHAKQISINIVYKFINTLHFSWWNESSCFLTDLHAIIHRWILFKIFILCTVKARAVLLIRNC